MMNGRHVTPLAGDCYMVVSGVPEASQHHALKLACFAIEMREALLRYNKRSNLAQPLVSTSCQPMLLVATPHDREFCHVTCLFFFWHA